jgi:hypothetical protein
MELMLTPDGGVSTRIARQVGWTADFAHTSACPPTFDMSNPSKARPRCAAARYDS